MKIGGHAIVVQGYHTRPDCNGRWHYDKASPELPDALCSCKRERSSDRMTAASFPLLRITLLLWLLLLAAEAPSEHSIESNALMR